VEATASEQLPVEFARTHYRESYQSESIEMRTKFLKKWFQKGETNILRDPTSQRVPKSHLKLLFDIDRCLSRAALLSRRGSTKDGSEQTETAKMSEYFLKLAFEKIN
jgi:hypothetical protein